MLTCGLPDSSKDDWTWLAIWSSVNALAARSATTRIKTITMSVTSGHFRRRLR
jgi:hypothetical protein